MRVITGLCRFSVSTGEVLELPSESKLDVPNLENISLCTGWIKKSAPQSSKKQLLLKTLRIYNEVSIDPLERGRILEEDEVFL